MEGNRIYRDLLWGFGAAGVLLIAFIAFSQSLRSSWVGSIDAGIGNAIQSFRSEGLTLISIFFMTLGNGTTEFIFFVGVGALLYFKFKHKWQTLLLFLAMLGTWGLNTLFKSIFKRTRPIGERLIEADGFSFPSGHAMVSSLFYGLIGYLLWINLRHKWKGAWLIPLATALVIISIGLSRIYLGVHYASDVLAGFAAGGAVLTGCILGLRVIERKRGA